MNKIYDVEGKHILLDPITREFLSTMKLQRELMGISQRGMASMTGITHRSISHYERGTCLPALGVLMRLADALCVDFSKSLNYRFYHRKINFHKLHVRIVRSGLSLRELSELTSYSTRLVRASVAPSEAISLACLNAILEVLHAEYQHMRFISDYLSIGRSRRKPQDFNPRLPAKSC